MKTRAAVFFEPGERFEIEELDLDDNLREGEVLIKFLYAGLCHSDLHSVQGDFPARTPMVLGHEGAGVIEKVGPGVTRVEEGDHVVCAFIPSCGKCLYCSTGRQSICDMGATILDGYLPGPHFPFTGKRGEYGAMCMLGTFSQHAVVHQNSCVPIDKDIPLDKAALVGCGVPTGWGSAVNSAKTKPGDTTVVVGIGGIGINAVQGARHAGAQNVIAVDPLENKRQKAKEFGATHTFASVDEAMETVTDLTRGRMADSAIVCLGMMEADTIGASFNIIGKDGALVLTGMGKMEEPTIQLPGTVASLYRKRIIGSLFGDCNPVVDIPKILGLYKNGDLLLDELITTRYTLDQVNEGYDDLLAGKNVRGIIEHEH